MHVLFVLPHFKPYIGGIERVVDQLSSRLLSLGTVTQVSILTTFSSYPSGVFEDLAPEEWREGRLVYRLHFTPRDIPFIYHSYNAGYFSRKLRSTLSRISPNVVHFCKTEWYVPNLLTYLCTRDCSTHFFFSSYHPKPLQAKHQPMVWFNRYLLKRMAGIHAPSRVVANAVTEAFGVPKGIVRIIPNGVEAQSFRPKSGGDPRQPVRILSVGRIGAIKQQDQLLEHFECMPSSIKRRTVLTFAGADDGRLNALAGMAQSAQFSNVRVLGPVTDTELNRLYKEADIFALPSAFEGFGMSVLEAMSFGVPVVAFDQGALAEVAQRGAILVDPYDWSQFCNAIAELVEDADLRARLGKEGRALVEENYNWDHIAEEIGGLYRGVVVC